MLNITFRPTFSIYTCLVAILINTKINKDLLMLLKSYVKTLQFCMDLNFNNLSSIGQKETKTKSTIGLNFMDFQQF